jgi:hypothetical protein
MTTTLNATTSNGLVVTPDNSGNIVLQYNGASAPAFSAYQNSAQTVSAGAWTKINFDTEEFDTNNNFASNRFTPTVAGYYQLNSSLAVVSSFTSIIPAIYKNGSQYKVGNRGNSTTQLNANVSSLVYLNGSTDYAEIYVYIGTSQNMNTGIDQTYFNGCLLRGA